MVSAPIVHVNADSPEDVIRVFEMAADYRQKFHNDFIIDLVCYRRYGHNEGDQPMFTQPRMYQLIERMSPIVSKYRQQLVDEGVIDEAWVVARETEYDALCDEAFQTASPDSEYVSVFVCLHASQKLTRVLGMQLHPACCPHARFALARVQSARGIRQCDRYRSAS